MLTDIYQSGNYDLPAATNSLSENVSTRLDRLRRTLERHRDESRRESENARHSRWGAAPNLRRRRLRPAGNHLATFEGRNDQYHFHSSESSEAEEDTRPRHAKRRKLNHHNVPAETKSYKYGHYGQVEPGRLKLDLYSCDGGVLNERGPIYYGEHNILKHDQSVYCSKTPKCNIILRHHDRTDFCLEKLYIVAPNSGFTAPVKEGSVTVGMTVEELIAMTDLSVPAVQARVPRDPALANVNAERLSLLESMRDPELSRAMAARQAGGFSPFGLDDDQRRDYTDYWSGSPGIEEGTPIDAEGDWPPLQPTPRTQRNARSRYDGEEPQSAAILDSGLMVTMLQGGEAAWPEDQTSPAVMADRVQRVQSAYLEDEEYEETRGMDPRYASSYSRLRRGLRNGAQRSREETPEPATETGSGSRGVTTVKFRIKTGQSRLTIKFDPPVSGTCILLQLQGPPNGPNMDIQSVLASGYAGPRFFPAQQCA